MRKNFNTLQKNCRTKQLCLLIMLLWSLNGFCQFPWSQLPYPGSNPNALYFYNADIGWVADNWGWIYKTTNGGQNWTSVQVMPGGFPGDLIDVQFFDANTGYVIDDDCRVFKTTDGGTSWAYYPTGVTTRPNKMLFMNENLGWIVGEGGLILKTEDGAANWLQQNSGITHHLWAITAANVSNLWVGGNTGTILKSTDGGASWHQQGSQGQGFNLMDMWAFSTNTVLGVAWDFNAGHGLIRTGDGGANWIVDSTVTAFGPRAVHFATNDIGYACASNGIYKSVDGGLSWHMWPHIFGSCPDIYCANENTVYFLCDASSDGVFKISNTVPIKDEHAKSPGISNTIRLEQNYPNPFNPETNIYFQLLQAGHVKLSIYDLKGREHTILLNKHLAAGRHISKWEAQNAAAGVYFYRLETPGFTQTKKMLLVK